MVKVANWCKASFRFLSFAKSSSYDEKSVKVVERVLLYKTWALMSLRLVLFVINFNSENFFIKRAKVPRKEQ